VNFRSSAIAGGVIAALVTINVAQAALPVIGFDPTGSGSGFIYADKWSNRVDSGVDVTVSGSGFAIGDVHSFHTQQQVDSFNLGGSNVPVAGLNSTFELTKTIAFLDEVISFGGIPGGLSTIAFTQHDDPYNNLTLWYDNIADGSANVPGDGAGTVRCYGANSSPLYTGASAPGAACAADDGFAILTGNLISNSSAFTAFSATAGVGGFDLVFEITSYDADYLDLSNLPINQGTGKYLYGVQITGSLIAPNNVYAPVEMWDGAPVVAPVPTNTFFRTSGDDNFVEVPAPATLALLGIGLGLLGARRRQAKA
jgi:hypothetical protein